MTEVLETPPPKEKTTPTQVLQKLLTQVYILYYRKGNNPHSMVKYFYSVGATLRDTVNIAKKHCEVIGGRFVRIEPFLSDLNKDEILHTGGTIEDIKEGS